jgi:1,4-dihydroxy-2-naphthoate octaprenyltransferase
MEYHPLRLKDAVNLAAPHTWAASMMPSILAIVLAFHQTGTLKPDLAVCLFLVAVLMQSSVNALNDYADFVKGTDTLDNSPDATDAVIVYGLRPETARNLGLACLVLSVLIGVYVIFQCGMVPLYIWLLGAAVVGTYSFGKLPVSYLPLGELVSGFVMGGLLPLVGVYMQTGSLDGRVFLWSLPVIIGIAMIMFSNNGCDIERDLLAHRHTLACLLGRARTDRCYRAVLIVWVLSPILLFAAQERWGAAMLYILEMPVFFAPFSRQFTVQLGEEMRGMIMGGIVNLNVMVGFCYCVAILAGG